MTDIVYLLTIEDDYGLVSMDISCIQSILYAKFNKCPINIINLNNLKLCSFYKVPSIIIKDKYIGNFSEVCNVLKNTPTNIDRNLSPKQLSESLAFVNLVIKYLKPATHYLYWLDQRNFDEFTNPWYMKALPFPFNHYFTKKKRIAAQQLVEIIYPLDDDLEVIKEYINKSAGECFSALSTRLGNLHYIHGDQPTSVDAVIYAYIAPIVKLPFPSNEIGNLLNMWPNLIDFVKRIDNKYLPDVKKGVKYLKKAEESKEDVSYIAIGILTISVTSLLAVFATRKGYINSILQ